MKNFWKITTVFALTVATTINAMANDPVIRLTTTSDAKTLLLTLIESPVSGETEIRLTDEGQKILYNELVSESNYIKKFNLENLEFGTFYFTVQTPSQEVAYTLRISPGKIIIADQEDRALQSVFNKENEKIYLNLLNTAGDKVKIRIYDSSNRVVHRENLNGEETTINKIFNFQTAKNDHYRIVVKKGTDTYHKNITIG